MLTNEMIHRYARVRLEHGREVPGAMLEVRDMHKKDLEEINQLIRNLTK